MKSLISSNKEITERINSLTNESKAEWGKMNVSQMLAHTQIGFQSAFGEITIKRNLLGILFGGLIKKQLNKGAPMKKNAPTAKVFIVSGEKDFKKEKDKLSELIKRFSQSKPDEFVKIHPFFGNMTHEEWDNLMWLHLDHHLRQFNV